MFYFLSSRFVIFEISSRERQDKVGKYGNASQVIRILNVSN